MLFQLLEFPFYRLWKSLREVQRRTQPVQQAVKVQSEVPCPSSCTTPPTNPPGVHWLNRILAAAPQVPITTCSTSLRLLTRAEDQSNARSRVLVLSLAESHLSVGQMHALSSRKCWLQSFSEWPPILPGKRKNEVGSQWNITIKLIVTVIHFV